MKCGDCPDYKTCRRQNDLRRKRHKCQKANEPFVPTNVDRIRAMSDEELARTFAQTGNCPPSSKYGYNCERCGKCWLDYLRQPVKDGDNE